MATCAGSGKESGCGMHRRIVREAQFESEDPFEYILDAEITCAVRQEAGYPIPNECRRALAECAGVKGGIVNA